MRTLGSFRPDVIGLDSPEAVAYWVENGPFGDESEIELVQMIDDEVLAQDHDANQQKVYRYLLAHVKINGVDHVLVRQLDRNRSTDEVYARHPLGNELDRFK